MRRGLAVIAAVGLIAGAFVVRSRLDARDEINNTPLVATIVCATELAAPCNELASRYDGLTVKIEEAGITRATLAAGTFSPLEAGIDAWLVPRPYPAMVTIDRQRAGLEPNLDTESDVLARSPLVVAIWNDRLTTLGPKCPDQSIIWKCLGDVAGDPWQSLGGLAGAGAVKVGLGPAERSATGLLDLAQGTAEQTGRPDYSRAELDDPVYRAWLTKLEAGVPDYAPSTGTALGQMVSQGQSRFDAVGSIEALAGPYIASSREKDNLTILYPSPDATADVVMVAIRGSAHGGRVTQQLQAGSTGEVLARNGWRVPGQPVVAGVRDLPLPDGNGLPDAGVFVALDEVWGEVHR